MLDEVLCNFLKKSRSSFSYFLIHTFNLALCCSFPLWQVNKLLLSFVIVSAGLINIFLAINLVCKMNLLTRFKQKPPFSIIMVIFPLLALGSVIYHEKTIWMVSFCVLLLITIGMDSGAWFFGKFFGRKKLCPQISPNKTVEGLLGGCLVVSLVGGLFWCSIMGSINFKQIVYLVFFGLLSQVGDLVQSKFKREYNVKDSSGLIPGHGGIYDRLDSVIFLAPFFTLLIGHF